jgi:hypothetical protein
MNITTVSQPEMQLGNEIDGLLDEDVVYQRIVFVSAFVALRTIDLPPWTGQVLMRVQHG